MDAMLSQGRFPFQEEMSHTVRGLRRRRDLSLRGRAGVQRTRPLRVETAGSAIRA
jgi:hypothetical protein